MERTVFNWLSHPATSRVLVRLFANLFAGSLTRQSLFHPALLTRFQVEGVTLHILYDVFRLNFTLESSKSILQRLALLQSHFCQLITSEPELYRVIHFIHLRAIRIPSSEPSAIASIAAHVLACVRITAFQDDDSKLTPWCSDIRDES
jgi:hypothetical protein